MSPSLRRFLATSGRLALLAAGACGRIGYDPLNDRVAYDAEPAEAGSVGDAGSEGDDGGRAVGDATLGEDADASGGPKDGTASDAAGEGCVVTNGGVEVCDGLDNDCDGVVDNGSVCGPGCTGATWGGHAYASCTTALGFNAAATDCASKSMRLARVDSAAENQFLYAIAFANPANTSTAFWPWIGGHDIATPVEWQWADGTVFWMGRNNGSLVAGLYSNWASAAPTDASGTYCTVMQRGGNGTWVDRGCANVQPYFCESY